jgi:hypothetical protein
VGKAPKSREGKEPSESDDVTSPSPSTSNLVSAIVKDKPVCSCGVRCTGLPKAGDESGESSP